MSEVKRSTYLLVIVVFSILLFGCTPPDGNESVDPDSEAESTEDGDLINEEDALDEAGVFEGDKAKDFYLEDNQGIGIKLSEVSGKPIILSFWTSWSVESESVNALLSECYKTYKDEVQFISLNVTAVEGNNLEYVIKHIRLKGYEFPIYFDLEGEVAEKYWISSFPTTYLIDKNGYVSKIYIGEVEKEELYDEIKKIEE